MRNLKKIAAVALTAAMTMAMGVSAFAQDVTFHFKNAKGWAAPVYGWICEKTDWSVNVSNTNGNVCPALNPSKVGDDGTTSEKPLWPGAKCTDEGNGWWKITVSFSDDVAANGAVMKFNNGVCDAGVTQTQQEDDLPFVQSSGLPTTATATKEECPAVMFMKQDLTGNEYWIDWTGSDTAIYYAVTKASKNTGEVTTTAPASYTTGGSNVAGDNGAAAPAPGQSVTDANGNVTSTDANGNVTVTDASGKVVSTTPASSAAKKTSSPKTGDTVAMTVVLFGLASAVAFVAAKKKINA